MSEESFPHLFLPNIENTIKYKRPKRGGNRNKSYPFDDSAGKKLLSQLSEIWTKIREEDVTELGGIRISLNNRDDRELTLKSLDRKNDIVLLNVKQNSESEALATVFLSPKGKITFEKQLNDYLIPSDREKRKYATLIDSIGNISQSHLYWFWEDELSLLPVQQKWVEIWLKRREVLNDKPEERFIGLCSTLKISYGKPLIFPERVVFPVFTNIEQLIELTRKNRDIVTARMMRIPTGIFTSKNTPQQNAEWALDLKQRTTVSSEQTISVLILDTGVNYGHPLLNSVMSSDDCLTIDPNWGAYDKNGHGTGMAGLILYGDMGVAVSGTHPIILNYALESSKIIPDGNNSAAPNELYGSYTKQGVYLAETNNPQITRICCMAITCSDGDNKGTPTSWSAAMDQLAAGEGDEYRRLIIVSSGNAEPSLDYPESNKKSTVQDPAQAWNVLTVGAYTNLDQISTCANQFSNYTPLASCGGLSPYSTTSSEWDTKLSPIKPEVLFEGGNVLIHEKNQSIFLHDDLQLLSLYHETKDSFCPFNATSAASALCAHMAAHIQVAYPQAWPETVRALVVHSARWKEEMLQQFLNKKRTKTDYSDLVRVCGYGVPDLLKALLCASDHLTLIAQAEIQPYEKGEKASQLREMHFYDLPWPSEALQELADQTVRLRVTLSYFPEPSPGIENMIPDKYRYPAFGLRFDLNRPTESQKDFRARVNAFEKDENTLKSDADSRWVLGQKRHAGSIHSDIWEGSASDLAAMKYLAIYPVTGWWKTRQHLEKYDSKGRYSLIVSIETDNLTTDIYTPVKNALDILISQRATIQATI